VAPAKTVRVFGLMWSVRRGFWHGNQIPGTVHVPSLQVRSAIAKGEIAELPGKNKRSRLEPDPWRSRPRKRKLPQQRKL